MTSAEQWASNSVLMASARTTVMGVATLPDAYPCNHAKAWKTAIIWEVGAHFFHMPFNFVLQFCWKGCVNDLIHVCAMCHAWLYSGRLLIGTPLRRVRLRCIASGGFAELCMSGEAVGLLMLGARASPTGWRGMA